MTTFDVSFKVPTLILMRLIEKRIVIPNSTNLTDPSQFFFQSLCERGKVIVNLCSRSYLYFRVWQESPGYTLYVSVCFFFCLSVHRRGHIHRTPMLRL